LTFYRFTGKYKNKKLTGGNWANVTKTTNQKTIDQKITSMDIWHLALPVNSRRNHGIGTVADRVEVDIVKPTPKGSDCL
jgi:hypothetical protein